MKIPILAIGIFFFFVLLKSSSVRSDIARIGMIVDRNHPFYTQRDEAFEQGVQLFVNWTNQQGGIDYGDAIDTISLELIVENATEGVTPEEKVANAARKLLTENSLDILFAPFALTRTNVTMLEWAVLTNATIPLFSPAGAGPDIYFSGFANIWHHSAGTAEFTPNPIEMVLNYLQRSVSIDLICKKDDPFWETVYRTALSLLENGTVYNYPPGIPRLPASPAEYVQWSNVTSDLVIDGADQDLALASFKALVHNLTETNAEVLIIMGVEGLEASIYNEAIAQMKLNPAAIIAPKPIDIIESGFLQDKAPENWIFTSLFHRDIHRGQTGKYLGTTEEFLSAYKQLFSVDLSNAYVTYSISLMLAWQMAVERSGLEWRNSVHFINEMKNLRADSNETEYFAGRIQFDSFGRNAAKQSVVVQYVGGTLKLIRSPDDLVYPAKWAWLNDADGDGIDTEATIGITVGVFAGFIILLALLAGLAILVYMIVWKKYFHMIILKRGNTVKEVGA